MILRRCKGLGFPFSKEEGGGDDEDEKWNTSLDSWKLVMIFQSKMMITLKSVKQFSKYEIPEKNSEKKKSTVSERIICKMNTQKCFAQHMLPVAKPTHTHVRARILPAGKKVTVLAWRREERRRQGRDYYHETITTTAANVHR